MFYGGPSLAEAKARGAVGALMDYPVTAPNLLGSDKTVFAEGHANMDGLQDGMDEYAAVLAERAPVLEATDVSAEEAARVNAIQMEAAKPLLPHLFDWDSSGIPGWTGIFVFNTYANDLAVMNKAIRSLEVGNRKACAGYLTGVTMGWGRYVGAEAYELVLRHIAYNPHLLWGFGYIPQLTDVHREYASLMGREDGGMTDAEVLASLTAKRDDVYGYVTAAAQEAGTAYGAAADILMGL
ncbi:MAG TPA: hypothetical protein VJ787_10490 [Thermoleophilia bacterium]|nr:hypothetical protein [Thermoleophilia bacterium]